MGRRTEKAKITGTRKRITFIEVTLTVVLTFLILRIYGIQMVDGNGYSYLSKSQYLVEVKGLETRGQILDRNGIPIAGEIDEYYYFIPREKTENDGWAKRLLSQLGAEDVTGESDIYSVYRTPNYDVEICKTLARNYGAYVLKLPERNTTSEVARSLVGSFDQETGKPQSGLELTFDRELHGKKTRIALTADSAGNIIMGRGPITDNGEKEVEVWEPFGTVDSRKGEDIETTLDLDFQRKCEDAIDDQFLKEEDEAICIVVDTDTGEILVIAQKGGSKTENPALEREMSVGEMTDFIVFACAMEKGLLAAESNAQNPSKEDFSNLIVEVGYEAILEKCYKMGFGRSCLNYFQSEAKGYLPYAEEITPDNIANLTTVSNPILATPTQMAKAFTILARSGRNVNLKLLKKERNDNADEPDLTCVFEKGVVERTSKALYDSWGTGEDRMMKAMGIEKVFAWKSEDSEDAEKEVKINNYWIAGELRKDVCEDGRTESKAINGQKYTILVVVSGGAECETAAENIILSVCS